MNSNSSHYRSPHENLRRRPLIALPLLLVVALAASSCSSSPVDTEGARVVATTSILGDVASAVVGDAGEVTVLVPRGADPHDYLPSSRQVADMSGADLVIANGLHLEAGLIDTLSAMEDDGVPVLWIGEHLDPLPFGTDGAHEHDEDPHVWLDPLRMADAAQLIAAELAESPGSDGLAERATAYADDLIATDATIVELLASIPADRRVLVTGHDAFGYFADRYGFLVLATVIPGGSTQAEPSSAEMANLVALIEQVGVPAIFTDVTTTNPLADAIAAEFDGSVTVVPLHSGSLGAAGSGAETLIDLLLSNARAIAEALS